MTLIADDIKRYLTRISELRDQWQKFLNGITDPSRYERETKTLENAYQAACVACELIKTEESLQFLSDKRITAEVNKMAVITDGYKTIMKNHKEEE